MNNCKCATVLSRANCTIPSRPMHHCNQRLLFFAPHKDMMCEHMFLFLLRKSRIKWNSRAFSLFLARIGESTKFTFLCSRNTLNCMSRATIGGGGGQAIIALRCPCRHEPSFHIISSRAVRESGLIISISARNSRNIICAIPWKTGNFRLYFVVQEVGIIGCDHVPM